MKDNEREQARLQRELQKLVQDRSALNAATGDEDYQRLAVIKSRELQLQQELDKLEASTKELTPRQVISLARLYHCQPEELGLGLDPDSLYGWRMYHGVSLAETARRIKVHWSKILDWENGLRTPSDAEIVRISGVTEIPIQSLMEAEGWWVDEDHLRSGSADRPTR